MLTINSLTYTDIQGVILTNGCAHRELWMSNDPPWLRRALLYDKNAAGGSVELNRRWWFCGRNVLRRPRMNSPSCDD